MSTIKYENCTMEVDSARGVIYIHSGTSGWSLLRLSNLPVPIPDPEAMPRPHGLLDINFSLPRVSWTGGLLHEEKPTEDAIKLWHWLHRNLPPFEYNPGASLETAISELAVTLEVLKRKAELPPGPSANINVRKQPCPLCGAQPGQEHSEEKHRAAADKRTGTLGILGFALRCPGTTDGVYAGIRLPGASCTWPTCGKRRADHAIVDILTPV